MARFQPDFAKGSPGRQRKSTRSNHVSHLFFGMVPAMPVVVSLCSFSPHTRFPLPKSDRSAHFSALGRVCLLWGTGDAYYWRITW